MHMGKGRGKQYLAPSTWYLVPGSQFSFCRQRYYCKFSFEVSLQYRSRSHSHQQVLPEHLDDDQQIHSHACLFAATRNAFARERLRHGSSETDATRIGAHKGHPEAGRTALDTMEVGQEAILARNMAGDVDSLQRLPLHPIQCGYRGDQVEDTTACQGRSMPPLRPMLRPASSGTDTRRKDPILEEGREPGPHVPRSHNRGSPGGKVSYRLVPQWCEAQAVPPAAS